MPPIDLPLIIIPRNLRPLIELTRTHTRRNLNLDRRKPIAFLRRMPHTLCPRERYT
jgi:hypothetical protein